MPALWRVRHSIHPHGYGQNSLTPTQPFVASLLVLQAAMSESAHTTPGKGNQVQYGKCWCYHTPHPEQVGNREYTGKQGKRGDTRKHSRQQSRRESLHNICRRDWWTWGSLVRNEKPEDKERLPYINKQKRRENARNKKKE